MSPGRGPSSACHCRRRHRGVNRSFWAMAWCLPPMGISWLWWRQAFLRSMPPEADVDFAFYF
ncbi:hypothetical protein ACC674_39110, partial [Rhizobium ruizarguesonis]